MALVLLAATVLFTWPLAATMTDHLSSVSPHLLVDLMYYMWALSWTARALVHDPRGLFDGNVFHPAPRIIAATEHLLGNQPIFAPVWLATGNPVLAINCVTLASYVLSGVFMYLLVRRWTGSAVGAGAAALAFAFAPWRFDIGRMRELNVQYFPLILYGMDRAAATGRLPVALFTAGALTLQVLCSYYLGYMAYMVAGTYLPADVLLRGWRGRAAAVRAQGVAVLAPLLVVVPLTLPYLAKKAGGDFALEFDPTYRRFVAQTATVANVVRWYAGWAPLGLGLLAVLGLSGSGSTGRAQGVRFLTLAVLAAAGFLLAPGPTGVLGGWVAPYTWLSVVVPGFANVRAPIRLGFLAGFALCVLAGIGVAGALRLVRRVPGGAVLRPMVATLALLAVLTPTLGRPTITAWEVPTARTLPAAHRWLAEHGAGGALLELPMGRQLHVLTRNGEAARATYLSTYHWLPLLNGMTSYPPPSYAAVEDLAVRLPDAEALQGLVDCAALRWVLVHGPLPNGAQAWSRQPLVQLVERFPDGRHVDRLWAVVAPRRAVDEGACRAFR